MKNPFKLLCLLPLLTASCQNHEPAALSPKTIAEARTDSAPVVAAAAVDTAALHENFPHFWSRFRLAVLQSDTSQLIKCTEFPLQTRGPMDDDTTIEFSQAKFVPFFHRFLNQWSGMDLNGSTELDGIRKTEVPGKKDGASGQARMGDLVFEKDSTGWKLVFAYLNNETIDSLK